MSIFTSISKWLKNPGLYMDVPNVDGFYLPVGCIGWWVLGVWPLDTDWGTAFYRMIGISIYCFTFVGGCYELARVMDDLGGMCSTLSIYTTAFRVIGVLASIMWHRKKMASMLLKFASHIWISKEQDEVAFRNTEKQMFPSYFCNVILSLSLLLFIILPAIKTGHLPAEERVYPFVVTYPFDYRTGFRYYIFYYFSAHSGVVSVAIMTGHETLLHYIMLYTCTRLKQLNDKLENFRVVKENGVIEDPEETTARFAVIVAEHNDIISFVAEAEDVFNLNIFAMFSNTMLLFCVLGIQIMFVPQDPLDVFKEILYFLTGLGQIYVSCLFGNEIIEKSVVIADTAYGFDWMDVDTKFRAYIILIIQRAQTPLYLTAGKFVKVSIDTFSSVCKTSGSYFTVLKTFMEEES